MMHSSLILFGFSIPSSLIRIGYFFFWLGNLDLLYSDFSSGFGVGWKCCKR